MNFSEQIIPISNLKSNASRIVEDAFTNNQTYIITQNGYAKMVLIGIKEYDRMLKELNSYSGFQKKQLNESKNSKLQGTSKKLKR